MAGSIEPRYGVRVYPNESGDICISQFQPDEREQVVVLHPEEAKGLIKLLEDEIRQLAKG